jgi:hypothetical protein
MAAPPAWSAKIGTNKQASAEHRKTVCMHALHAHITMHSAKQHRMPGMRYKASSALGTGRLSHVKCLCRLGRYISSLDLRIYCANAWPRVHNASQLRAIRTFTLVNVGQYGPATGQVRAILTSQGHVCGPTELQRRRCHTMEQAEAALDIPGILQVCIALVGLVEGPYCSKLTSSIALI